MGQDCFLCCLGAALYLNDDLHSYIFGAASVDDLAI
jgi:hypothetical protein